MGMARGAEVLKGSFSVPADYTGNYIINFGKSFSRYIYIIEMTDESKTALAQTGENNNKTYARLGLYPPFEIEGLRPNNSSHMSTRINPSTQAIMSTVATTNGISSYAIAIATGDVTQTSANLLYLGYSYNYTIISLDNV